MTPDAYAIFLRTRTAISAARYPSALDYTIAVSGDDGTPRTDHYNAYCALGNGKIIVNPISAEEAAHPRTPHGINLRLTFRLSWNPGAGGQTATAGKAAGNPEASADLIGVPMLSPTYMFGLRYERVASAQPAPSPSHLRTIAVVAAGRPNYAVALSGNALVDNVNTYELQLTPLRDPKTNRLRTLWVGVNDYLARKAVVAGNFTVAPLVDVPWTIDFPVLNGAPVITNETPDQTLFMAHHHIVRNASIAFVDVRSTRDSTLRQGLLVQQSPTSTTLIEPRNVTSGE